MRSRLIRYFTDRIDFGVVNSVNEGVFSLVLILIFFGVVGNDKWNYRVEWLDMRVSTLYLIFSFIICAGSMIYSFLTMSPFTTVRKIISSMSLLFFLTIGLGLTVYSLKDQYIAVYFIPITYTYGFLFSKMIVS